MAKDIRALTATDRTAILNGLGLRLNVQRILRQAQKGISPITGVMASPPTHTVGAANAASTINANGTSLGSVSVPANGRYQPIDARFVEAVGGAVALDPVGTDGYFGQNMIANVTTSVRRGSHGLGLRFATDAAAFDVAMNTGGKAYCCYVTDLVTGVRARTAANDLTGISGNAYYKWDFGSRGARGIEIYQDVAQKFRAINVDADSSLWLATSPDESRVAVIWDSFGEASNGGAFPYTNKLKLGCTDFMGEVLGVSNVMSLSRGGTGFVSTGPNSTEGNYLQRINGGDLDVARIGVLDLVVMPGSVNDTSATDSAVQAATQSAFAAAMAKQPNAVIVGMGPPINIASPYVANRFTAMKAGFEAAAAGDPRMVWIDTAPSSTGCWLLHGTAAGGTVKTYIDATDNVHLKDGDVSGGHPYLGRRLGRAIVGALRERFPF